MSINLHRHRADDDVYVELAPRLRRVLALHLQVSSWVLDDACQAAWEAWLRHPGCVSRDHLLGWLATTARREALALMRRSRVELCLEASETVEATFGVDPGPQPVAEFRDELNRLRGLPARQQRIVWMQSLGFEYSEIAARTGETRRSVERQLASARRRLSIVA